MSRQDVRLGNILSKAYNTKWLVLWHTPATMYVHVFIYDLMQ